MPESDPISPDSPPDDADRTPALLKEPSFSRWCVDDATAPPPPETDADDEGGEGSGEFELPLLIDEADARGERKRSEPFDVVSSVGESKAAGVTISTVVAAKVVALILLWYTFSTFLTVYNKTLLGEKLGKFPAPMLMNTIHFAMQAVASKVLLMVRRRKFGDEVVVNWRDYFFRVVPTALGTALDINLSNASLVFISVTFATMCKSAAPIFLLVFAFLFRLENPSIKLLGIIIIISVGVLLTVAKETEFELWGFIFVMLAAVMSGFRWCMTQILLQKEGYGLKDPITLMSYVTPVMAVATLMLSLMLDPWDKFDRSTYFNSSWHLLRSSLLMLLGGTLAFFMVLTEYALVSATSAITVTIAGVVKEAITILVAVIYFHDQFTILKGFGLLTIMVGVSLFNWYKYLKLQKRQQTSSYATVSTLGKENGKYVILEEMDFHDDKV